MLVTFLKPKGNFFKKVINIPDRLTTFINEIFNQKMVNLFQDKTHKNLPSRLKGKVSIHTVLIKSFC